MNLEKTRNYKYKGKVILTFLLFLAFASKGQDFPNTEIYLFDIETQNGSAALSGPVNITKRYGYDNQPSFTPDGKKILYSAVGDDNQADVFSYDIKSGKTEQLTQTATSEFSPEIMGDKKHFSVVMVEADSTQRIWKYPLYGHNTPLPVMDHIDSVGYYCWFYKELLAYFKITDPASLHIVVTDREKPQEVASKVGRSIKKIPNELAVSFTDKSEKNNWKIKKVETNFKVSEIVDNWQDSEDYCWTPDGYILITYFDKIYSIKPGQKEWRVFADLSHYDLCNLSRIAVSPDGSKLAVVNLVTEIP